MPTQTQCLQYARTLLLDYLSLLQDARQAGSPQNAVYLREAQITHMDYRDTLQQCRNLCSDPQCLIAELNSFGVTVSDTGADPAQNPLAPFDNTQLQKIVTGVRIIGRSLATYVSIALGRAVSSRQAFQYILGPVQFEYVPARTFALTEHPTNVNALVRIWMAPASFSDFGGSVSPYFVVAHELGHVFHLRQNTNDITPLLQGYAAQIQAVWIVGPGDFPRRIFAQGVNTITVNGATYNLSRLECADVRATTPVCDNQPDATAVDPQGNILANPPYYFHSDFGTYYLGNGNFSANYNGVDPNNLFDNEICSPEERQEGNCNLNFSPEEGFADTFANMMLNPQLIPSDELRRGYFLTNIQQWINDILIQRGIT